MFSVNMTQLNVGILLSICKTTRKPQHHQQMQSHYRGGSLPNVSFSLANAQNRLDLQVIYCFALSDCVFICELIFKFLWICFGGSILIK